MAIKGSLSDVSLADICQLLAMGRKTGCLTVTDKANFGYVYFNDGRVIHASVLNRPDRLGDLLVQNGVITREQLSLAMDQQTESPPRLGAILIELGFLTEEDLHKYITIQVEEAVYHLFSWAEGIFNFNPDQTPETDTLDLSINAETLLLEGARRVDEWSQIEKKISSMDLVFSLERDPSDDADVELTEDQVKIIELLDGNRSVEELVSASGLVEFDTAKALYGLVQAGFARESGRRVANGEEADVEGTLREQLNLGAALYDAGMLEDATQELEKVISENPGHPRARGYLALVDLKSRRFTEALDHLESIDDDAHRGFGYHVNRAYALERSGRHDDALEALRSADEIVGENPKILVNQAIVYLRCGKPRASVSVLKRYRQSLGQDTPPPIYYSFAVLAAAMAGDVDAAVAVGREGLTHYPNDANLLVNTGVVLERKGDEAAAEVYFIRAAGQDGAPAQAHKNLGDRAYDRADHAGAGAHYQKAIEISPLLGDDVYVKLGNIAFKEGDEELASKRWKKALSINAENETAQASLELIAADAG